MNRKSLCFVLTILISATYSFVNLASAETLETLQVSSLTGEPVETSFALELGQEYLVEVTGTYYYAGVGGIRIADAEFALVEDYLGWQEEPSIIPNNLDLFVNGTPQDWLGSVDGATFSPHTFSPDHTYRLSVIGGGVPISFAIYDSSYDGNDGYLTVTVSLRQSPVANAGDDQVVFDEATLDGSQSQDPDGSIVSYNWELR